MGFLDELKKMTRPYDDDDEFFDDEDEAIPVAEAPAPERPAPARPARRTAPAAKQSSFIRDDPVSEPVREPRAPRAELHRPRRQPRGRQGRQPQQRRPAQGRARRAQAV